MHLVSLLTLCLWATHGSTQDTTDGIESSLGRNTSSITDTTPDTTETVTDTTTSSTTDTMTSAVTDTTGSLVAGTVTLAVTDTTTAYTTSSMTNRELSLSTDIAAQMASLLTDNRPKSTSLADIIIQTTPSVSDLPTASMTSLHMETSTALTTISLLTDTDTTSLTSLDTLTTPQITAAPLLAVTSNSLTSLLTDSSQNTVLTCLGEAITCPLPAAAAATKLQGASNDKDDVIFYAYLSSSTLAAQAPLIFDNSTVNKGDAFNVSSSDFTAPEDGLYWFHLTATPAPNSPCDYRMVGTFQTPNVIRSTLTFKNDTLSRDELQVLRRQQAIYINSDFPLQADPVSPAVWAGFRLDSAFNPLVAFLVGITAPSNVAVQKLIPFNTILVDTSNSWNLNTSTFVVPQAGAYFFTVQMATSAYVTNTIQLKVSGQDLAQLSSSSATNSGPDTVSRSTMALLYPGDNVTGVLVTGRLYSDIRYQTSLLGFLYSPRGSATKIAWSVHSSKTTCGPVDPVAFDYVLLNEGLAWYTSNRLVVPKAGLYYINLSGFADTSSVLLVRVLLNGQPLMNLLRSAPTNRLVGYDSRARSAIVRLQVNDELRIGLPQTSCLYSDTSKRSSFTGFWLSVAT